jgi:hypothetical protein
MLSMTVHRLLAWSPNFSVSEKSTLSSVDFSVQNSDKYVPTVISAAQSRRLSDLTKSSVDLALRLTHDTLVDHVVFSSRHGELVNATKLLEMIGKNEVLSPMLFSQSVHNAAIGSYTLLKKNHAATTSLGGGKNSFMMGLVSCAIYLKENPHAQVLYIAADERVPATFENSLREENVPHAAAFLFSNSKNGCELNFSLASGDGKISRPQNTTPQTLEFLDWFFSPTNSKELNGEQMTWNLSKC